MSESYEGYPKGREVREVLSRVSDRDLARVLLVRLLWAHDRAGVSGERSLRNTIASAALRLLPTPSFDDTDQGICLEDALAETERRRGRGGDAQLEFSFGEDLSMLSSEALARLLLRKLAVWYLDDERMHAGESLSSECAIVERITWLLRPLGFEEERLEEQFSLEDLLREAESR